ncbi:TetR/AcrR family transcriptional regulator [Nocardia pseudovaccinii]|uniref:TetR/AcrR family transcriptional regulator n=1 Tax=Nocardia pseudovaccinii TaxID=189540 RepID=UPI0007A3EAD6|nr:TetR/AcrR family transcriptional regulator [Nocardia pseudovaccinii]
MTDRNRTEFVLSGGRHLRRVANPVRQALYDEEVDKLIRVTQDVMLRKGRTELPTVAEIVRAAGVTNQAFYRHFRSRDDAIVATYEQGLLTLHSYLEHHVSKCSDVHDRIRAWIDGVLAQIEDPGLSELSAVILWNVGQVARDQSEIEPVGYTRILDLLDRILADAGVADHERTALFVQTLVLGMTARYHGSGTVPTPADREQLLQFCFGGIGLD